MSLQKIREAVQAAEGNARQMGEVVLMIAQADVHAAEVIAADLDNPEMSFDKCFAALRAYAQKHQKGGFWGCMCNSYDPENPVIKVAADFYKVNLSEAQREDALGHKVDLGAAASETPETQPLGCGSDDLDLMDLL